MSMTAKSMTIRLTGGLRAEASLGDHRVAMDEPLAQGGGDTAMTPVETLLASLGGCTAITLRLYSQRKDWPLEGVQVRMGLERPPRTSGEPRKFTMDIQLDGPLDDAQRARLLDIAGRCPVHRMLEGGSVFEERLVESMDGAGAADA